MAAMFESSEQAAPIISAPVALRPWTKIIAAFAAGFACAALVGTFSTEIFRGSQPKITSSGSAKIAQRTPSSNAARPEKSSPSAESAEGARVSPGIDAPVTTPSPAGTDAPGAVVRQSDPACKQQTWPYLDHECAGADANAAQTTRPVRVIPTDRTAPSTVVTAAPLARPTSRATKGMSTSETSVAQELARRTTDGVSAGEASVASPQQMPAEQAPAQQARVADGDVGVAQVDVPMPKPKPETLALTSSEPSGTESGDARETARVRHTTGSAPSAEPHSAMGDRENTRRSRAGRETAKSNVTGETRRTKEATTRTRMRSAPATEDEDGYTLVRSRELGNGRRITVYEKPIRGAINTAADDEAPRPRTPFFFNPAASGY